MNHKPKPEHRGQYIIKHSLGDSQSQKGSIEFKQGIDCWEHIAVDIIYSKVIKNLGSYDPMTQIS